jgi:hypothetical protein
VAVAEETMSPELVLVSPPELAAQAREALPDYEIEFERWVVEIRTAFEAEAAVREEPVPPRLTAFAFTALAAVICVVPLVLLILFRR